MIDILCGYTADRDETLVAYLYGEIDQAERAQFEAHVSTCDRCRRELAQLRELRGQLQTWSEPSMPEPGLQALPAGARTAPRLVDPGIAARAANAPRRLPWDRWRPLPVWAKTAAALLVLGASAGLANLDVRYGANGLAIRTGWLSRPSGASHSAGAAPNAAGGDVAASSPWRTDLQALEERLQTEIHASPAPPLRSRSGAGDDGEVLRQVRALLRESERQQQNDLALRIAEVMKEFDAKRNADLMNINQSMRAMQSNTGIEVLKQREALSRLDYLVRASGQR
jgi:anti-sigma factor RsiW